jgi:RNA polymerase sigma factor (sigma-70 family)
MSRSATVDAYLRAIGEDERDGHEVENAVAARMGSLAEAEEARRALACAHLRFVVSIASRYRNLGLPFEDLVSEGNIGLMQAARLYDPAHGTRFMTYAVYWIRRAILRALTAQRTLVHVPCNQRRRARGVREAERALSAELHRPPTPEEVAHRIGLSRRQVEDLLRVDGVARSLADPLSTDLEIPAIDRLPAAESFDPHHALGRRDAAERIRCAIGQLSERSRQVIERRYGLGGDTPASLRDLAGQMGVTAEAVRLMEIRALAGLRRAVVACGRRHRRVRCGARPGPMRVATCAPRAASPFDAGRTARVQRL